jgi:hypothetical protein
MKQAEIKALPSTSLHERSRSVSSMRSEKTADEQKMVAEAAKLHSLSIRYEKFKLLLEQPKIDTDQLRKLAWPGIPDEIRPTVWKLLFVFFVLRQGYLPINSDRRDATLQRKRQEYVEFSQQAYSKGIKGLDQQLYHQIHIDIQRTNAHIKLYQQEATRNVLFWLT